jgi:hypothetical protein
MRKSRQPRCTAAKLKTRSHENAEALGRRLVFQLRNFL